MFIYVGKSYTATLGGSRIVPVTCERCRARFAYELTRVGVGRSSAPYYIGQAAAADRAAVAARKDLARRLERESEMVPCPKCQWVNEDLIARYRRRKYRPLAWIALAIGVLGIAVALGEMYLDNRRMPSGGVQVFLGICLLFAAAIFLLRYWLRGRIDPNRGATGRPVLPSGTPPALVERPDSGGGPPRLEPVGRPPGEPPHSVEWVVLRPNQVAFPQVCCLCLDKATMAYDSPFKVNENSTIDVPLCGPCAAALRIRWWFIALITVCLTLAVAGLVALTFPGGDTTGRWIAFVMFGLLASVFAIAVVPNMACRPYRFGVVDADRGIVRFSARNPEYNALLEQRVRESDGNSSKLGPFRGGPEDLA